MLQKGIYPYEYMDDWEKFDETSLLEKEDFYSHLKMELLLIQIIHTQEELVKILKQKILVNVIIFMFKVIHYCWLMYLTTFRICIMKYMD